MRCFEQVQRPQALDSAKRRKGCEQGQSALARHGNIYIPYEAFRSTALRMRWHRCVEMQKRTEGGCAGYAYGIRKRLTTYYFRREIEPVFA